MLTGVNAILTAIKGLLGLALPIAFGLAVLFFFWGVARYILAEGNPNAKEKGRQFLVWGVIAMFVLISIWGLVKFIGDNLNITTGVTGASTSNGAQLNPPN